MTSGLLFATALMVAQIGSPPEFADPRIQTVAYSAGQVVRLAVENGYAAVVELGPDERVDSVIVGDTSGWQVTASRRGDHIVVKPLGGATTTDMVVVTGDRRYVFLLQPGGNGDTSPFVLRFVYPDEPPVALTASVPIATFRFRGDKSLFPVGMRDDGHRTTISWGRDTPLPAIFAIAKDGREGLVNGRMVGGDYVVEGVAPRYVFRLGKAHASASRRIASNP